MKLKKIFIKTLLLAIPCTAFAASSDALQIERIATQEDGTVILYAKNGWGATATNACSTSTGVLAFKATTAGGKAMLSTALAAQIAQKLVVVATSDSLCTAVGGWAATVTRVDVLY
ncbi:MAG TPA: hypothetical protein VGD52_23635 [Pseudoduganella sp.]